MLLNSEGGETTVLANGTRTIERLNSASYQKELGPKRNPTQSQLIFNRSTSPDRNSHHARSRTRERNRTIPHCRLLVELDCHEPDNSAREAGFVGHFSDWQEMPAELDPPAKFLRGETGFRIPG